MSATIRSKEAAGSRARRCWACSRRRQISFQVSTGPGPPLPRAARAIAPVSYCLRAMASANSFLFIFERPLIPSPLARSYRVWRELPTTSTPP